MASSLASCVSAAVHAPRSVQNFKNSRRPTKDVNGGVVDTTKSSRRRFGKLRQRGEMCIMHEASVAPEELERTSRNAGPRSVHFPASAGYNAPWISHRADEVPLAYKKGAATATAALLEKQVSFQPRKSRRISPKNAVVGDNSTWVELLVVSRKKGSNRSRSLFFNIQNRHAYWDEPPTGASEVVFLGDVERLNALMASVERKQQIYRDSCQSVAAAAAKVDPNGLSTGGGNHSSVGSIGIDSTPSASTQSTSLNSASSVSWLSSHVGFYTCTVDFNTTTSTTNNNTIVQTRMMLLLFVINVSLVAFLFSIGGIAIPSVSHGGMVFRGNECFIHAVLFQGALLAWHLWPSSK